MIILLKLLLVARTKNQYVFVDKLHVLNVVDFGMKVFVNMRVLVGIQFGNGYVQMLNLVLDATLKSRKMMVVTI